MELFAPPPSPSSIGHATLGLTLTDQNLLFAYFMATLAAEVREAKAEGKYSEGEP